MSVDGGGAETGRAKHEPGGRGSSGKAGGGAESSPGSDEGAGETSKTPVRDGADESRSEGCFAEAMRDVKPLADRGKVRHRRSPVAAPRRRAPVREEIKFEFPQPGEPLLGHAGGIQRRQLERLRSGGIRPESSIDLHRFRTDEARAALHRRLIEAHAAGQRCVVVIHGRGLHSQQDSVLKRALPSWLTDSRVAHLVLAFAPARPKDGGEGASYVLLKRSR